jgi:hypothetical protein
MGYGVKQGTILSGGVALAQKVIRLFVSSTFQDMAAERDLLKHRVFPQLSALCATRGLEFIGIDLRWGITAEDSAEKRTLKVCLDEIDRCRPYFAGILGTRYGWRPPKDFFEVAAYDGLSDASITEVEMEYGALGCANNSAVFCVKSGAAADPGEERSLAALRARIRKHGSPVLDGYEGAEAAAEFLLREVTRIIQRDYPTPMPVDAFAEQRESQDSFIEKNAGYFIGRGKLADRLVAFANQGKGALLVDGAPGSGKTALLSFVVQRLRSQGFKGHIFSCFEAALSPLHDWRFSVERLLSELHGLLGTEAPPCEATADVVAALAMALRAVGVTQGRVLLVFDGVDALANDPEFGLSWLPHPLPRNVCAIFVTADLATKELLARRSRTA